MNLFPENTKGQRIQTNVNGLGIIQGFIAHLLVSEAYAVAASNISILAATGLTTEAQSIKEGITNPGIPRNIKIVGNASGIAGNVVIKGTNYNGNSITETIVLNGTTEVEGVKAFKTVTEIDLPIQTNVSGDAVSVGFGEKLGIPYKLSHNTVLAAYLDNAKEATSPTVITSAITLENNTIKLNSALNGKNVDVYLIV